MGSSASKARKFNARVQLVSFNSFEATPISLSLIETQENRQTLSQLKGEPWTLLNIWTLITETDLSYLEPYL